MGAKHLQIQQLDARITRFARTRELPNPPTGWIKALRMALGMSMEQLGRKLGVTRQSVYELENREKEGGITLSSLRQVAASMDMEVVYGFVPREGSLEQYLDRKASELAQKIVLRTSDTMRLEDQENAQSRIQQAIEERTKTIRADLPKALWD